MATTIWNKLLTEAVRRDASDIHFSWVEGPELEVRLRRDGRLEFAASYAEEMGKRIVGHIKATAGLDISERRKPQDGRIKKAIDERWIELRVTTIATIMGENVAVRVLDPGKVGMTLVELGLDEGQLTRLKEMLARPNGLILVAGPTGSGKTSTLYAFLRYIQVMTDWAQLISVEDPVEHVLPGVTQVPVAPKVGLDFPNALRAILRMDPDYIMIGEVRDPETAEIAVRAGLTGHLVLSSMHTNHAAVTPATLVDWGVDPPLVAAALVGVIAPRLVRRICPKCRTQAGGDPPVYFGAGCKACARTGYKGRLALFEVLPISRPIRRLIREEAAAEQIQAQAEREGVQTLLSRGLKAMRDGLTTADEIALLSPPGS